MAAEASEKGVSGEEEKNTIAQIWKLWFKMPQLCNFVKVAKFCHFCMVWLGPEGSKSNTINQYLLNVYKTKYDNDLELQVDILLFPEDGLSGFEFPKAHLAQPFLQTVRRWWLGVIHILRNHFWGSRQTPPPLCNL